MDAGYIRLSARSSRDGRAIIPDRRTLFETDQVGGVAAHFVYDFPRSTRIELTVEELAVLARRTLGGTRRLGPRPPQVGHAKLSAGTSRTYHAFHP
jgi:hypothetical protein